MIFLNNMSKLKLIFLRPALYYHALYWFLNALFFTLVIWSSNGYKDFLKLFHENIAYLPGGMIFTYFSVNYLIPEYFFRNKVGQYITLQIAVLALYPVLSNLVNAFYISPVIYKTHIEYGPYTRFLSINLILIFGIVPLAGVKILNKFRYDALIRQRTEHDRIEAGLKLREAELKLLRGQIHPHFLFNTLNNIYLLSLEKSEKTPDLIIRLSDMLSYIIYDCDSEKVLLTKEIKFIESFLELQKIRYDRCNINIKIGGGFNDWKIAPMILHTFIDNSFKHGADKDSGSPWINIVINADNGKLYFTITNSKRAVKNAEKNSGIGLSNALKRLELLYPGNHDLVIDESDNTYSVHLKLELKENGTN